MPFNAPIEVRTVKAKKIIVGASLNPNVMTADFVSGPPKVIHMVSDALKAVLVGKLEMDLRDINLERQGRKVIESRLTAARSTEMTA